MWKSIVLVVAIGCLLALPAVSLAKEKREAKPRFKGVELYSWKDKDGNWKFALLDGTNAQKTEQDVKSDPDVLAGADALTKSLRLLAEGEEVFWGSHRCTGFELPDAATQKTIAQAAKDAKIKLDIDKG